MATGGIPDTGQQWRQEMTKNLIDDREKRERRLILIGKSGHGKSSTGNSICGYKVFSVSSSASSHTKRCRPSSRTLDDIDLIIYDTPGLYDTGTDPSVIKAELGRAIQQASPGPHAFLIHFKIGNRFTDEEQQTVKLIQDIFGKDADKYCILVLSGGDNLLNDDETIEKYLDNAAPGLKQLLIQCQNRYLVFNNRASKAEKDEEVRQLLKIIEKMLIDNQSPYYTNEQFQQAEQLLQEREQAVLTEKIIEIEKQKQSLREEICRELEVREKAVEDQRRELEKLTKELRQQNRDEIAKPQSKMFETACSVVPAVVKAAAQVATAYLQLNQNSNNDQSRDSFSNMISLRRSFDDHHSEEEEERSRFTSPFGIPVRPSDLNPDYAINSSSESDSD